MRQEKSYQNNFNSVRLLLMFKMVSCRVALGSFVERDFSLEIAPFNSILLLLFWLKASAFTLMCNLLSNDFFVFVLFFLLAVIISLLARLIEACNEANVRATLLTIKCCQGEKKKSTKLSTKSWRKLLLLKGSWGYRWLGLEFYEGKVNNGRQSNSSEYSTKLPISLCRTCRGF